MEMPPEPPDTHPRVVVTGIEIPFADMIEVAFKAVFALALVALFFAAIYAIIVAIIMGATS